MSDFTHLEEEKLKMVNIKGKKNVDRKAIASGKISITPDTSRKIKKGKIEKGNVQATIRIAAIQAVKKTWVDIPLCHPIPIEGIDIDISLEKNAIRIQVEVDSYGKTGVEMEALSGVAQGLLTAWDMVKSNEKDREGQYPDTSITDIKVDKKVKDKSNG